MGSDIGKRRSDGTRAAILTAARERFAAEGYERTTIRAVAADARIDPAMVMRYYGSKEKLFDAAADFDLRLPDLAHLAHNEIGGALVRHFLDRWEHDESLLALLRGSVTSAAFAERMREILARQLIPSVAAVCPDPAQVPMRAALVATQMLGFALCRYILRLPPALILTADDAAAWLGPTIQRYLTSIAANPSSDPNSAPPLPQPIYDS